MALAVSYTHLDVYKRQALEGYERAQMDGLCHEGAWECAIEAIRALDLQELIVQYAGRVTVTGDI